MEGPELNEQDIIKMNKVILKTTAALLVLTILNYIIADIMKYKLIPFPDGIIIICGIVLVVRSTWLLKLNITRKYHSKRKTTILMIATIAAAGLFLGYYTTNANFIIEDGSLSRNFTIGLGAVLLICGMWVESLTGTRALIADTEAK